MKDKVRCLLSAFFAVLYFPVQAQVTFSSMKGKVLAEDHSPAETATIILLKARDSSIVSSTIIGKDGLFMFGEVPTDNYLLLATSIGYNKLYAGPYHLEGNRVFRIPDIILKPSSNQLKEVIITSGRPEIEVKPGKITLNIPSSLTATGNSAFEILRQAPGVRVDNSNNISIIGRQNALITIDGKPTNLSGEDLASYLRSLQSNIIDRIELITGGSAKYDASAGGIVNIVLKKGNNVGANGTFTATAGYGKYYKSNIGITFNNRTDKFNVFGNYNYSANKTFHNFTTDRIITNNDLVSNYHVDYRGLQTSSNHSFNLGTDYFISGTQTLGFLINGFSREDDFTKDNELTISNQGVIDSTVTAKSAPRRHVTRVNYNLNYSAKLGKAGSTLSADVNYTTFNRSSVEYITNDFYNASMTPYREPLLFENLSPSKIHVWLSKVDFYLPLSKTSKLETGVKHSRAISNNDQVFGTQINGVYLDNPNLSNHFLYSEYINAAYINFQKKFDKYDLTVGLRGERTSATGNSVTAGAVINRDYFDLFPQMQLIYKKDSKNDFALSYSRGIARPLYEDINPFLYYVDLYDYRSGNPGLKPQYANTVELSHTYNKTFTTTLYTTIISDAYDFNFYVQNDTSKVNITTRRNLGTVYNYGVRFFAPVRFTSWWNANFYADLSYQRYVAYPINGNLNKGTQDAIFTSTQNFKISNTIAAELSGRYESPTFYGVNQIKANYRINGAIAIQLFDKKASLRLNVSDIFNTLRDRSYTNYQNLNLSITDKKESQVARLTFTYYFGKRTVKAVAAHRTGNEEEQKRIGSGVGN